MNIELLKEGIALHKKNSPKTYKDSINMSVPLFVIHKKIITGAEEIIKKEYDLTNSELDVLASLVIGGGSECILSPTALYDRLVFSSGGMTKILKKLVSKDYIIRIDNSEDKRSKLVKLTSKGRALFDMALKEAISYESGYFECLEKEEKENLEKILFKILENND